ncbi:hypothetical protein K431DRAFT_293263 [Polychaeton citri CBS 116435]|uniref:Zn(2)-C6 fungal-type domain-containing protein n=1 Tax=Polychaeton citri CBS 116435 TaxID=1314669 RepID=A0A9P4US22_9PEZI|nr:hypothetical protein K431DRAFT_293263 [Polychaeton citri CBS 116435]
MEGGLTQSIAEMASSLAHNNATHTPPQIQPDLQQRSQDEDQADSANGAAKRKSEEGQPQQRAKRNRYISIACNECKRRKIKCNGQTPCQRCGNLNLECVYAPNCCSGFKDSLEFKQMSDQIAGLQDQVALLWDTVNALRVQFSNGHLHGQHNAATPIDPSLQSHGSSHRESMPYTPGGAPIAAMSPSIPRPRSQAHHQPRFHGPTSSQFNFSVAKNSLQTMGITSQQDEQEDGGSGNAGSGSRDGSPNLFDQQLRLEPNDKQLMATLHTDKDPIWSISHEDAVRLCKLYEDEMGLMYPVLNIDKVIGYTEKLYRFMEAAHRTGLMQQGLPGADAIDDEDTNILKLVVATALTVEASGRSELGERLFDYVQPAIDRMLLGSVGVKGIRILTMAAMYEFHRDNEGTSWRIIGLTARLCIELGLHRLETYEAMEDQSEREETLLLFWAIYVLDRRWSFGTGMPFSLQDGDIDARIPRPDEQSSYLSAMIQFSNISSKVWHSVAAGSALQDINPETMGYLDYQIMSWHRNVPLELRFEHPGQTQPNNPPIPPPQSRAEHRLRAILYLRANTMRVQIYRPVLHSATMIMKHREQAQVVVDVAKDSIRVLTHINQTTDLYRSQQVLFNAFLTGALAVLFLAVSHAPAIFADNVREEFHMALDLVRGLSKGSWVSKRLWKTIRVLKEFGPKLGITSDMGDSDTTRSRPHRQGQYRLPPASPAGVKGGVGSEDPSRSAAVAMAGLAGHNVDEMALFSGNSASSRRHNATGGGGGTNGATWSSTSLSSNSPDGIANDLNTLFEAAGAYQQQLQHQQQQSSQQRQHHSNDSVASTPAGGYPHVQASDGNAAGSATMPDNVAAIFGGEDGLSNILKELF